MENKLLGSPEDYHPLPLSDLIKLVEFPSFLEEKVKALFSSYLFSENTEAFNKPLFRETRDRLWFKFRKGKPFKFVSALSGVTSKKDLLFTLVEDQEALAYVLTPTKSTLDIAEERLREAVEMGLLDDEGELRKDVLRVLLQLTKPEKEIVPVEGKEVPSELLAILKKAGLDR